MEKNGFTRMACRQVCGTLSRLVNNDRERSQPTVCGANPGWVALGCIRKRAEWAVRIIQ